MVIIKTELLEYPNEEQFDKIYRDLNIDLNEYKINEMVFFQWLEHHEDLSKNYEKHVVSNFLRLCKNDLGRAKTKYEEYIAARSYYPEIFHDRYLVAFENNLIYRCLTMVPQLTEECYRILILRIPKENMIISDFQDCLKYLLLTADFCLANSSEAGLICLIDCAGITFSCIRQLSISFLRTTIYLMLKIYPSRMRAIHLLNVNRIVRPFISMVKTLLPTKLKQRLEIHASYSELLEKFPPEYIPKDYGGSIDSCEENSENWRRFLMENKIWVQEYDKLTRRDER